MIAETPRQMIVAGLMSGTSADGVDVAVVRITPGATTPTLELLAHRGFAYPEEVRAAVLAAMDAQQTSVAELARLHWRLGEVYADCIEKTRESLPETGCALELIGVHGQTIYHQATPAPYDGELTSATWQMGEAAVIRERLGVPVVSDLRAADLAAGGQGAPLVPVLDYAMYRSAKEARVMLNLGGIANMTVLPAGCAIGDVTAFDTGPANIVMDALASLLLGEAMDRGGAVAASGREVPGIVDLLLGEEWFLREPPKSCGREDFGREFVSRFRSLCGRVAHADVLRTALELTVRSVAAAVRTHGLHSTALLAAGGGVRNTFLMSRLGEELRGMDVRVVEEPQAKEAVAFALMAWLTWFGLSGNVSSATGARGPRVLGKISW